MVGEYKRRDETARGDQERRAQREDHQSPDQKFGSGREAHGGESDYREDSGTLAETVVAEFPMEVKVFGDHPGQSGHQYEEIGDRGDSADGNEKTGLWLCENESAREE